MLRYDTGLAEDHLVRRLAICTNLFLNFSVETFQNRDCVRENRFVVKLIWSGTQKFGHLVDSSTVVIDLSNVSLSSFSSKARKALAGIMLLMENNYPEMASRTLLVLIFTSLIQCHYYLI